LCVLTNPITLFYLCFSLLILRWKNINQSVPLSRTKNWAPGQIQIIRLIAHYWQPSLTSPHHSPLLIIVRASPLITTMSIHQALGRVTSQSPRHHQLTPAVRGMATRIHFMMPWTLATLRWWVECYCSVSRCGIYGDK